MTTKARRQTVDLDPGGSWHRTGAGDLSEKRSRTMLLRTNVLRRIAVRGLGPSPLSVLHHVRACQSAAAQPSVAKVTIDEAAAAAEPNDESAEVALEKALRPKEIVEQLDRYIIGQPEAKRAVAVAMRNRWRRQRVASPLKEEVRCDTRAVPPLPSVCCAAPARI